MRCLSILVDRDVTGMDRPNLNMIVEDTSVPCGMCALVLRGCQQFVVHGGAGCADRDICTGGTGTVGKGIAYQQLTRGETVVVVTRDIAKEAKFRLEMQEVHTPHLDKLYVVEGMTIY